MPTDSTGRVTPLGTMCAGLIAGVTEAVAVVTPGETIKTKMIDDWAGPRLYRSTGHGIVSIIGKEGVPGLYRGVIPVVLKQHIDLDRKVALQPFDCRWRARLGLGKD